MGDRQFMKLRLQFDKMQYFISYFLIGIVLILIMALFNHQSESYLFECGIIIAIHIIISLFVLKKINGTVVSIAGFFLIILFVLHYGQIILMMFESYTFYKGNFITRYPSSIYSIAIFKTLVITTCMMFGFLFSSAQSKPVTCLSEHNEVDSAIIDFNKNKCKKVGTILSLLLIPLRVYIDVQRLILSITRGYVSSLNDLNINNALIVVSRLSTVAIVLLLYGLPYKSRARKFVFFSYAIYLVVFMFSGSRISFIISLIILCMCYLRFENIKLSFKSIIIIAVSLSIVTAIMAASREYRYYNLGNNVSMSGFFEVFVRKLTVENSVLQEIEELGQSIYTCSAAVDHVDRFGYAHGTSYILGITTIMPNIGGLINALDVKSNFARTMVSYGITANYENIGGSIIGELIFNFQYIYPIIAFIIGWFIMSFSRKFDEKTRDTSCDYSFIYSVCIMMGIFEWSRDCLLYTSRCV